MKKPALPADYPCPVEAAFDAVGGKWKGVILYHLLTQGPLHFDQLRRLLPARCTRQALTNQLRELEGDGVLNRKVHAQTLPKVEHSLTAIGESIRPLLFEPCEWDKIYQAHLGKDSSGTPHTEALVNSEAA